MSDFPTTQIHLLLQVRDRGDQQAWIDFVALYRPAIYRFARRRGLQEADAQDLAQTVLSAVADRIDDWKPDADRASFRTWLSRVAQNQAVTLYRKRRADAARGGSSVIELLSVQADQRDDATELITQYRREVFRMAAREVRQQVEETSWQAFWMTSVERTPIAEVAKTLALTPGAIYTARSRIVRRLQLAVQRYEQQDESLTLFSPFKPDVRPPEPDQLETIRGESE
jgi:RNA polymerase sigma factor (sigma-70 family)